MLLFCSWSLSFDFLENISDSEDSDGEGGLGNVSRVIIRPPGHRYLYYKLYLKYLLFIVFSIIMNIEIVAKQNAVICVLMQHLKRVIWAELI